MKRFEPRGGRRVPRPPLLGSALTTSLAVEHDTTDKGTIFHRVPCVEYILQNPASRRIKDFTDRGGRRPMIFGQKPIIWQDFC